MERKGFGPDMTKNTTTGPRSNPDDGIKHEELPSEEHKMEQENYPTMHHCV